MTAESQTTEFDISDAAPIIGMACAIASSHFPSAEPIWIAIAAFVCGMSMQNWWSITYAR